ncbi:pentapeptide repeat-containing protein [Leptolyngbya sp. FACHB-321]|uniref:pentapeptide repeat-containing protein n=1 Tax=Leptolyngbya sp. FACHB-321 TaxID=2692807 RepID=UPI0016893B3E|nr:pentapeptide repeat-containing protein [Leptolyngbya sp. FACHB-321]MBD2036985.1 pentapeptide repeat-containing protein [Leptolyngbya sp. FACHB-321]
MNQSSQSTPAPYSTNLRGQRVSQAILSQLDFSQCLLGLSVTSRIGVLALSLLLSFLGGTIAGIAGAKLALDLAFDFQGWRYLTIAITVITLTMLLYWARTQFLWSTLVTLLGCWLGLPLLTLGLRLLGLVPPAEVGPFVVVSALIGTLLTTAASLSVVGLSLANWLFVISFQKHFRWLRGLLLGSFIALSSAVGLIRSATGDMDNQALSLIRQSQEWVTPFTQLLGWLGGSLLAMGIVWSALQFLELTLRAERQTNILIAVGRVIANFGGTSFRNLDLSHLNFSGTSLANVDLRAKKLYRTCFLGTAGWEAATVDSCYLDLDYPKVQTLLSGQPTEKTFCRMNLRGAYLRGDLQGFDFTEATLDGADLRGVNLRYSKFVRTLVTDVDFTQADLTGCCLKDWSFNHQTRFEGVICDYMYRDYDHENSRPIQRYPLERNFEPGEFEAIVRKLETSYELVFDQQLDPISLSFMFEKFRLEDESLGLELQGLEQRGEFWIVKVGHREGVSRQQVVEQVNETYEDLRDLFEARYQLALEAKEGEIARLSSYYQVLMDVQQQFLQKMVERTGSSAENVILQGEGHRIYFTNQIGEIMENQNISAGGNVDASTGAKITVGGDVTGSTLNLGTISGQVTNLLQQLKDSPVQGSTNLAEILTSLQTAIQEEQTLPDEKKQEALEAVATLAEEGKKPSENRVAKLCSLAVNALKGIASTVSDTSKLVGVVNTSLPFLKGLLGLV